MNEETRYGSFVGWIRKDRSEKLHKTPTVIRCNNKSTMYTYFPKFWLLKSLSEDRVTTQYIRNKKNDNKFNVFQLFWKLISLLKYRWWRRRHSARKNSCIEKSKHILSNLYNETRVFGKLQHKKKPDSVVDGKWCKLHSSDVIWSYHELIFFVEMN